MSFLNPLFLFGLIAAAIPVIIHLFTRRRPREVPFPSLQFLTEVNQSEVRRLRIKQWLLLLLRTLAVAAIALAMARPALRGSVGPRAQAATTAVVMVDRSGSMGARAPGGGRLIDEARRTIEGILATLGPQDEILLVPYDRAPQPVTPRPTSDLGRVRAANQALAATADVTDHRRALEAAATALDESHSLNRELFWISDFQAAGWRTAGGAPGADALRTPAGPWQRARVYLVPLAARGPANVALTDVSLSPADNDVALSVTSRSHDAAAGDLAVEVLESGSGASLGRGFLGVPSRGEAVALLPLARMPEAGGVAVIPEDALALDNRRVFAAGRSGLLRVRVREDGPPSPLRMALEAGSPASGLEVRALDAADLAAGLGAADALVLNDLDRLGSAELQAVLDFHRAGGGILLVLGPRADAAFWNGALLRETGAGELGPPAEAGPGGAWRLLRAAAGHAALAGFPARPGEPVSAAQFTRARAFRPGPGARAVLEFDRAHPALIEAPRTMVFAASLDPADSDFPVSGAFLPLLHQVTRVLARGTAAASLLPGARYIAPAATGEWRIVGEDGRDVAVETTTAGGATRIVSAPLERPGLYRVLLGGALRSTFAVNPDPAESDLAAVPERSLVAAFPDGRARVMRPGSDFAQRVREARYGRELWSWFVLLALALLAAETIVGRWGTSGTPGAERKPVA